MDVLIESTKRFEQDLDQFSQDRKSVIVKKINDFSSLFPDHKADGYRKLRRMPCSPDLNGYDSSLYILKISEQLRLILTIDEDPIFKQVIFTLFRVIHHDDLNQTYQGIAKSLYQDIVHHDQKIAQAS